MTRHITINGRPVGPGHPTYVIAEMSANHNQSFDEAIAIVRAAKDAGADAIKLQTYTADTITIDSNNECFQIKEGTIWAGRNLYGLYAEAYTPWDWQPKLQQVAKDLGLDLFSSPFDSTAADFLESMQVPAYKIASFELVDIPLIQYVARKKKPMILSTGMATLSEIEEAVTAARNAGATEIALLKCNSAYPAPPEDMNLRAIAHLAEAFDVVVGLSDHTLGGAVPVAAVALGAAMIEKHITMSRAVPGPDSAFSLEPREFKEMIDAIRTAERAVGKIAYAVSERERASRIFRRSLFVVEDIAEGELFTSANLRSIRPANGLHPRHLAEILGNRALKFLARGTPLAWDDVGR